MVTYSSNAEELMRETRPSRCLKLDAPAAAGGGTVGARIAATIAGRIHERGMRGEGTAGAWDRNAPATVARKGFDRPNVVTGQMLDTEHIAGDVASTAAETTITYGTGATDARGVSDRDRAHYAETGQSAKEVVRSFFGLVPGDCDALAEVAGDEWDARAGGPAGIPGAAGRPALPGF